jgi:hypothetical protein
VPEPDSVPLTINSQGECTILQATQSFQALSLIFLQPKKISYISIYFRYAVHSSAKSRASTPLALRDASEPPSG